MFRDISINYQNLELHGRLMKSHDRIKSWVIFAHGSGSSHKSKRNNWVAEKLNNDGFGALLFDLLTSEEDDIYLNRFNIPLLSQRLIAATSWLMQSPYYQNEKIGYFGASTGAAAALMAAANAPSHLPIYAIVGRGGRADLAEATNLNKISIPTLLIVGGHDEEVIRLNELAGSHLINSKLVIVPGANHLFEEEGALEEVVRLTSNWFSRELVERWSENHLSD